MRTQNGARIEKAVGFVCRPVQRKPSERVDAVADGLLAAEGAEVFGIQVVGMPLEGHARF